MELEVQAEVGFPHRCLLITDFHSQRPRRAGCGLLSMKGGEHVGLLFHGHLVLDLHTGPLPKELFPPTGRPGSSRDSRADSKWEGLLSSPHGILGVKRNLQQASVEQRPFLGEHNFVPLPWARLSLSLSAKLHVTPCA